MEWDDKYRIDIETIDSQHKELFRIINRLIDSAKSGQGRADVADVLKFLEDYVVKHFSLEEKYMGKYDYSEYEKHKAQHGAFVANFMSLKKFYEAWGASSKFLDLIEKWVTNWLKDHIQEEDQKFGKFLKAKEINPAL